MKAKLSKKGVAGLNIFLGVIVMLFMIGLLVMVFSIAGDKMYDAVGTSTLTSVSAQQLSVDLSAAAAHPTGGVTLNACAGARSGSLISIDLVYNGTANNVDKTANISIVLPCNITNSTTFVGLSTALNVTYTYQRVSGYTAQDAINETTQAIGDSTDWFGTFIVLAALIVLILMVVLIVTSIRGTGYVGGNEGSGSMFKPKEGA